MSTVLTAEDFDVIEQVACPLNELMPPPYDDPHNTARLRPSMMGTPLNRFQMIMFGIRMERFLYVPEFSK